MRKDIAISPQFFGWVAGIGPRMQIESPNDVRTKFLQYLCSVLLPYQLSNAPEKEIKPSKRRRTASED